MEKQDILLRMMEHPEKYSDQQWQEILNDPDCRRLYDMLSLTHSAVAAKAVEDKLTDDEILSGWTKVEKAVKEKEQQPSPTAKIIPLRRWKVAAVVIAVVGLTGLAVAAVSNHWFEPRQEQPAVAQTTAVSHKTTVTPAVKDTVKTMPQTTPKPKTFVNVPLVDILTELSSYYHVQVIWKNEQAKQLRFYFEWDPQDDMDAIADKLNHFQSVQLSVENGQLVVE